MRFYVRKRHSTPAVIIVALIDVLIVLVIFLLVTTTFKQQSALRLQLPASAQAKKMGANENRTVVVSVNAKGMYFMDDLPVTSEQMQMKLKMAALQNPNVVV
ncbi:MAG: biopolymer transporter ExbD, partial [Verrucomicrobia bacterium]|nr:biopolymer transporter ExbD [Verrucomicrobiota bacterium]